MKIGKKLLVGFGIPVALMVVIAILVVVMNLLTVTDIKTVGIQTDLWSASAESRRAFLNARRNASVIYYAYSEDEYNQGITNMDAAIKAAEEAGAIIEANPEQLSEYKQIAADVLTYAKKYKDDLVAMHNSLLVQQDDVVKVNAAGATFDEDIRKIIENINTNIAEDFAEYRDGATPQSSIITNRQTRIHDISEIILTLAEMRVEVRSNLAEYTEKDSQLAVEQLNSLKEQLAAFKANTSNTNTIEAVNEMEGYLATYEEALTDYIKAGADSADALATLSATAVETLKLVNQMADQNDAVNEDITEANNIALSTLLIVAGVVILAIIITIIMATMITKLITGPIGYVTSILKAIGTTGRTNFTDEEWAEQRALAAGKDECAECADYLGKTASALGGVASLLTRIADGDLDFTHEAMSDDDIISHSLINMLNNLNEMFGATRTASDQVSTGAAQISDASQNLAQGSTEQAATVEELSASIEEVSIKTKQNAERAVNAAHLSESIKDNAQKGSEQMTEMTAAVAEINVASQDISKVIKVIDDIAFQTNILALNAAVEAARAGEAGKGFAVVADEVRNLASKSAAAAKETGVLIENSMKKAELGSTIAAQTAASLTEIVDGINRSTDLITEIADSSEQQSVSISQINDGIVQVSEVVQKNSATAEECAASAEELNAQSTLLAENVSRFRLRKA
ncbi:MAG: methyl-accepting chemotaxis protein [Ruminococcus sp.]|jgi:methyl-accepting chemotaxis protein|nr:methyl-accepting chemotaxis protein [Ruminococcus sp.]